jgi:hypothetical protein
LLAAIFGALVLLPSSLPTKAYATVPGTYAQTVEPQNLDVNLTFGGILRILSPSSSNISIMSLSGGQYDLGLYTAGTKNDLLFTPAQIANYTLMLNISTVGANSASLSSLDTTATAWTKNVTGFGNLILNISIIVLPQPVSQSSGWNPLFGFTGISLGGVTLGTTDILAIFAIFSVSLMILGIKRSQKLFYAGLFFLSLIGIVVVGILFVAAVIGSYLGGFLIIRSYFGYRSRRQGGGI